MTIEPIHKKPVNDSVHGFFMDFRVLPSEPDLRIRVAADPTHT